MLQHKVPVGPDADARLLAVVAEVRVAALQVTADPLGEVIVSGSIVRNNDLNGLEALREDRTDSFVEIFTEVVSRNADSDQGGMVGMVRLVHV
jgi:hypothetical protein